MSTSVNRTSIVVALLGAWIALARPAHAQDAGVAADAGAPAVGDPAAGPPAPDALRPAVPAPPAAMCTLPPATDRAARRSLWGVCAALASDKSDAELRMQFRTTVATEIENDADWREDITKRFEALAHQRAAKKIATNERHVVWAYGAIWLVLVLLVAVMWERQRRLAAEIARLEAQLKRVEADDERRGGGET